MVYRDDVQALEARYRALEADLAERRRARDEVAGLLAEARAREDHERVLIDAAMGGPARRRTWRIVIAGAILLTAAITGDAIHRANRPVDELAQTIDQYAKFADKACRCTDAACGNQVVQELNTWATSWASKQQPSIKPDDARMRKLATVASRFAECVTKALEAQTEYFGSQAGRQDP